MEECWLDLASLQRSNKGPFWSESQQTKSLEKVFITFDHFLHLLKFRFGAPRKEVGMHTDATSQVHECFPPPRRPLSLSPTSL